MIASSLLLLAAIQTVRAQATASLFPVGFMDDGLQGEVIGTGSDGTTYRLSATFDELGVPYTLTMVEDATHVSITAVLETAGATVPVDVQCVMAGGEAVCREAVGTGIEGTTVTESGAVVLTAVPIDGASGGGVASSTTSVSIAFSSTDGVLPPVIGSTTAGGASTTDTSGGIIPGLSGSDGSSGAMKTFGTVVLCCAALPAILAFLNTLL